MLDSVTKNHANTKELSRSVVPQLKRPDSRTSGKGIYTGDVGARNASTTESDSPRSNSSVSSVPTSHTEKGGLNSLSEIRMTLIGMVDKLFVWEALNAKESRIQGLTREQFDEWLNTGELWRIQSRLVSTRITSLPVSQEDIQDFVSSVISTVKISLTPYVQDEAFVLETVEDSDVDDERDENVQFLLPPTDVEFPARLSLFEAFCGPLSLANVFWPVTFDEESAGVLAYKLFCVDLSKNAPRLERRVKAMREAEFETFKQSFVTPRLDYYKQTYLEGETFESEAPPEQHQIIWGLLNTDSDAERVYVKLLENNIRFCEKIKKEALIKAITQYMKDEEKSAQLLRFADGELVLDEHAKCELKCKALVLGEGSVKMFLEALVYSALPKLDSRAVSHTPLKAETISPQPAKLSACAYWGLRIAATASVTPGIIAVGVFFGAQAALLALSVVALAVVFYSGYKIISRCTQERRSIINTTQMKFSHQSGKLESEQKKGGASCCKVIKQT